MRRDGCQEPRQPGERHLPPRRGALGPRCVSDDERRDAEQCPPRGEPAVCVRRVAADDERGPQDGARGDRQKRRRAQARPRERRSHAEEDGPGRGGARDEPHRLERTGDQPRDVRDRRRAPPHDAERERQSARDTLPRRDIRAPPPEDVRRRAERDGDEPARERLGRERPVEVQHAVQKQDARGRRLEREARRAHPALALPRADPHEGRAFEHPQRAEHDRLEGEREGERREDEPDREEGVGEKPQPGPRPDDGPGAEVDRGERGRAPRAPGRQVRRDAGLEDERRGRQPEHERPVDGERPFGRIGRDRPHGEADREREVDRERQHQERLDARVQLGPVGEPAPPAARHERGHEPDDGDRPPRARPRDAEHAEVQERVVAQEEHVRARGRPREDGRGEAARDAEDRQCGRVLHERERAAQDGHGRHQRDRDARRDQRVQRRRRVDGEVEDGHAAALERQREGRVRPPQPPPDERERDADGGGGSEAHLDREEPVLGRVPDADAHADEQDQQADARERVAAGREGPRAPERLRDVGLVGEVERVGTDERRGRRGCGGARRPRRLGVAPRPAGRALGSPYRGALRQRRLGRRSDGHLGRRPDGRLDGRGVGCTCRCGGRRGGGRLVLQSADAHATRFETLDTLAEVAETLGVAERERPQDAGRGTGEPDGGFGAGSPREHVANRCADGGEEERV